MGSSGRPSGPVKLCVTVAEPDGSKPDPQIVVVESRTSPSLFESRVENVVKSNKTDSVRTESVIKSCKVLEKEFKNIKGDCCVNKYERNRCKSCKISSCGSSSVSMDVNNLISAKSQPCGENHVVPDSESNLTGEKLRNYKRSQYKKRRRIHKRHVKQVLLARKKETIKEPSKLSNKELKKQIRTRERLQKIWDNLEGDVIPRVPYEASDEESLPIGITILNETITIPPQGGEGIIQIAPIDETECTDGTYAVEGLGRKTFHSVGDCVMANTRGLIQVKNWNFSEPWVIEKGDQIAIGRKILWEMCVVCGG
jgi:hypothetical protein